MIDVTVHAGVSEYMERAMARAEYRTLDDGMVSATIPVCPGVIEFGSSRTDAEARLRDALSGWVELGLRLGHPMPAIDGVGLDEG